MERLAIALIGAVLVAGCGAGSGEAPSDRPAKAEREVLVDGLSVPWEIAFLPSDAALVTERSTARILRVPEEGGRARNVMKVPGVDPSAGEGGLLGLALSPNYRRDRMIYAYLTSPSDNRVVRFRLGERPETILTGLERESFHDGGRIAFGPDGMLYVGTGDAGDPDVAQNRGALNGKILRMKPNGGVPSDNPFGDSLVWSLGHRNVQGLAWDRAGRLWATEFGENRFDEVNLITPGSNYGWPIVEGRGDTEGGKFTNPQVTWRPAESSPSGAEIRGRTLYVAALRGERLWRIKLRGNRAGEPKQGLKGRYGRLRTVALAPDNSLWVATSNDDGNDRIIRLSRGR